MHALGQLTGGLAHDINNILTVVSGNLDLALEWVEQAEARDAIRRALDAVEMGAGVNRRLLTFARRRKLEPRRLNINAEVQETMRLLARTLGEQTPLTCKLAPDLWQTCVDPARSRARC